MIVYRIQDKDGRGPFKPGLSERWLDPEPKPHEETLVPWPIQFPDVLFHIQASRQKYCGCACASPEQLRLWFSVSEFKRLNALGYQSVMFEPYEILGQSDVQLVFRRLEPLHKNVLRFLLYPNNP